MSRLKDVIIDVQADLETVSSNKPHLTQNQLFATVCVMRDLREDAQKVDYDFVKEVYNLAFGDES